MMTITYEYEGALYVNLTNRCDCGCVFCLRHNGHKGSIYADDLWLEHEPTVEEALASFRSRDLPSYREIVFCGFGEPSYRLEDACVIIDTLKAEYPQLPPIRMNTNGHANLIHRRDVTSLFAGRFDAVSISLNGQNAAEYCAVTRPRDGEKAWEEMLDFTRKISSLVPSVVMTIVDQGKTPEGIARCDALARSLGATLRVREYIPD